LYTIEVLCGLLQGDLDCNCVVDVEDIMKGATKWRMTAGHGDWDPDYDLDKDNDVDIVDLMGVVGRWGDKCQARH